MDYSIIGFPRIGIHRELKFATEAYFRSEIDADELKRVVSQQRMEQWTRQRDAGAGFIPSNDFSLYDGMLDTAYMLNAIPRRYADLRLSDIDTYFAMARGYQGAQGDVKAFTMKKWFNTNYHYMVPELDDDMELKLRSDAFLDGFHQARSLGIQTKPVVAGPFTFLKLARCTGNKSATDFVDDILFAYADILKRCGENGVEWLQVDEPYLVMDLTMGDVALFRKLYQTLLEQKGTVKVLLQTYFGDVRDCYRQLCELPFDGIGLDFVEGKQTAALVAANGFPKDKILFAGLVNGKNIWRTNYKDVLERIAGLKSCCDHIVLSTSCSLLHVPYTVKNEPQLSTEIIRHFSFAYEKLDELRELCCLAELADYSCDRRYLQNQELFQTSELRTDTEVQKQVAALTESDFTRRVPRKERQATQKELLNLPLLPTTTIGSFPQTKEVKQNRTKFRKGAYSAERGVQRPLPPGRPFPTPEPPPRSPAGRRWRRSRFLCCRRFACVPAFPHKTGRRGAAAGRIRCPWPRSRRRTRRLFADPGRPGSVRYRKRPPLSGKEADRARLRPKNGGSVLSPRPGPSRRG